jgi:membrane protein implicated in regulation of membrane protease activity
MTAYRDPGSDQDEDAADGLEPHLAAAVVDVFVYVVVLNLFVEYLFSVTLLILALLLSRAAVRRLAATAPPAHRGERQGRSAGGSRTQ